MVCVQLEAFVLEKCVVVVLGDFPVWLSLLYEIWRVGPVAKVVVWNWSFQHLKMKIGRRRGEICESLMQSRADLHASSLVASDSAFSSVKDCLISLIAFPERAGVVEVVVDAS